MNTAQEEHIEFVCYEHILKSDLLGKHAAILECSFQRESGEATLPFTDPAARSNRQKARLTSCWDIFP